MERISHEACDQAGRLGLGRRRGGLGGAAHAGRRAGEGVEHRLDLDVVGVVGVEVEAVPGRLESALAAAVAPVVTGGVSAEAVAASSVLKHAAHVLRPPRWRCHVAWRPRRMGNGLAVNNLTSSGAHFRRLQVRGPNWHMPTS